MQQVCCLKRGYRTQVCQLLKLEHLIVLPCATRVNPDTARNPGREMMFQAFYCKKLK